MASFNFTVPDPEVPRILAAYADLYPIPEDPENPGTPLYTQAIWAKMQIREQVKNTVRRSERRAAEIAARESIVVDDTLISDT